MKTPRTIPNLHYVAVPLSPVFSRAGHATVFYRHDKDGVPCLYDVRTHYGDDGRKTRAAALRCGRAIVTRQQPMGLRNTYCCARWRARVRAAVPGICLEV